MSITSGPSGPDRLRGVALKLWRDGAWKSCIVSAARSRELLKQYPPELEWGRPGILAGELRTMARDIEELRVPSF